jgi:hypothetical protein
MPIATRPARLEDFPTPTLAASAAGTYELTQRALWEKRNPSMVLCRVGFCPTTMPAFSGRLVCRFHERRGR